MRTAGKERNLETITAAKTKEIPAVFKYLEGLHVNNSNPLHYIWYLTIFRALSFLLFNMILTLACEVDEADTALIL